MFDTDRLLIISVTGAVFQLVSLLLVWPVFNVYPFTQNKTPNLIPRKIPSRHSAVIFVDSWGLISGFNDVIQKHFEIRNPAQNLIQMTRKYLATEEFPVHAQKQESHFQDEQKRANG